MYWTPERICDHVVLVRGHLSPTGGARHARFQYLGVLVFSGGTCELKGFINTGPKKKHLLAVYKEAWRDLLELVVRNYRPQRIVMERRGEMKTVYG